MAARSMRVGVSIGSPPVLGLDCAHDFIGLIFPLILIIVRFCVAARLNIRAADHETMVTSMMNRADHRIARAAYGDCIRAVHMSIYA